MDDIVADLVDKELAYSQEGDVYFITEKLELSDQRIGHTNRA